jgi:hypoxanthine phosphoribosyltransferase
MKQLNTRLLFSADEIASNVQRLARKISTDYDGCDLVLVGVLKGTFIFLADLVRQLTIPVEVDFVRLASYGTNTSSCGKVRLIADVQMNLQNRDVLIVEDIIDTGLTMEFLREHLLARQPRSLKLCVLLDKKERRDMTVPIDYRGLQLEEGFVVGYGLDCNEAGRHLPDICEMIQ